MCPVYVHVQDGTLSRRRGSVKDMIDRIGKPWKTQTTESIRKKIRLGRYEIIHKKRFIVNVLNFL